jgi:hypothetical protein
MYGGSIALSGLTGGKGLSSTVFPFILRGVNLLGIEAVSYPMNERRRVWARLGADLKPRGLLDSIAVETDLDGLPDVLGAILNGAIRGRTLIRIGG